MFYTVIIGHFMAACFACLGLINCALCIGAADRSAGNAGFFPVLAAAAWPLAVAVVMEILLQMLMQLEELNASREQEPKAAEKAAAAPAKEKPQPKAEEGENVYFPVREKPAETPVSAPQPTSEPVAEAPKPAVQPTNVAPDNGLRFFKVD